jgi:hypothetical protein
MAVELISYITQKNNNTFFLFKDVDGYGGYQIRSSVSDRNSIPDENRKEGMLVYSLSDKKFYQLDGGITNSDWVIAKLGVKSLTINTFPNITTSNSNIYAVAATFDLDLSEVVADYGSCIVALVVVAETTGPTMTIRLFNYTDNGEVSGTLLTTTSTIPETLITGDISSYLTNGSALYQVQIKMDDGLINDVVTLDNCYLLIQWI